MALPWVDPASAWRELSAPAAASRDAPPGVLILPEHFEQAVRSTRASTTPAERASEAAGRGRGVRGRWPWGKGRSACDAVFTPCTVVTSASLYKKESINYKRTDQCNLHAHVR